MKDVDQTGFSIIEAVLALAVVGVLGLAGWYVYHAKPANSKTQSSSSTTSSNQASIKYTSNEFGFGFTYPQSWGSVSVKLDSVPSGTTGSAYDIAWSSSPIKLTGTFTTRDYKLPVDYQGSAVVPFAYSCPPQSFASGQASVPVVTLYNLNNTCVAVTASETVPGNYAVLGIEKGFSGAAKVAGISFTSEGDATGGAVMLTDVSEESVRNAFGTAQTQQLLSFAKSIHTAQ